MSVHPARDRLRSGFLAGARLQAGQAGYTGWEMGRKDQPETVITPYRDGPLLVRGGFRLQDQDGNLIDPGRQTIALCRCGKSRSRPFCDGSHKLVDFRAPSARERGRTPD